MSVIVAAVFWLAVFGVVLVPFVAFDAWRWRIFWRHQVRLDKEHCERLFGVRSRL